MSWLILNEKTGPPQPDGSALKVDRRDVERLIYMYVSKFFTDGDRHATEDTIPPYGIRSVHMELTIGNEANDQVHDVKAYVRLQSAAGLHMPCAVTAEAPLGVSEQEVQMSILYHLMCREEVYVQAIGAMIASNKPHCEVYTMLASMKWKISYWISSTSRRVDYARDTGT